MRAESAVEPTRSENITVTWRRSARSSGDTLAAPDAVAASAEGACCARFGAKSRYGIEENTTMPECGDTKLLQVLSRQAR